MLNIDDALALITSECQPLPAEVVGLSHGLDLILAQNVVADLDLPPFDKSLVDGFAVRSADLAPSGQTTLTIVETVHAGTEPKCVVGPGQATRIMTGAPLPQGADAVLMVENCQVTHDRVTTSKAPRPGQNWMPKGREMKAGQLLLSPGARLTPPTIGLLASVGCAEIRAVPQPRVAVVPTGDELVGVSHLPGPGQIRDSNGPTLDALVRGDNLGRVALHSSAPDDRAGLLARLTEASASADVLLVCGGVSAGDRDLVPWALSELGVEPRFHGVAIKPGKPLWFGVRRKPNPLIVFGLPGNPSSVVVSYLIFVRRALALLAGQRASALSFEEVPLARGFDQKGDRTTFHPSRRLADGSVEPMDWAGSPDLRTLALSDGFAVFPPGDRRYEAGSLIRFFSAHARF